MPQTTTKYQKEHGIVTKYVSVWIDVESDNQTPQIYYCSQCRCPVFQYEGQVIKEIPGGPPKKVPALVQCPNKKCGRKYYVVGVVK